MAYIPRTCPDCGEALDAGEVCECQKGEVYRGKPYRQLDKHLEACLRAGQYVQPGYTLGYKRS